MENRRITPCIRICLRWLAGLVLPPGILFLVGLAGLALEYRTGWIAAGLGEYLLRRNPERGERGVVWQAIRASRDSRSQLGERAPRDSVRLEALPSSLRHCQYQAGPPAANRVMLRSRPRPAPLRLERADRAQMKDLARSLQLYRQGAQLLADIELPREVYRAHARIQAQIALEDGSLFTWLHRALLAAGSSEGWSFTRMSPTDRAYGRAQLAPLLSPADADSADRQGALHDTTSLLPRMCADLLRAWEDSLYATDLQRLRQAWAGGEEMQIRLVRSMDRFTGYAIVGDDPPARFSLPAARVAAALGPHLLPGDEP